MPARSLHLVVDDDLGPALWVREQVAEGRSRAAAELTGLRQDAPPALAAVLGELPSQLRHRIRLPGRAGAADRRVPAAPLAPEALTDLVEACAGLLAARFGEETAARLAELAAAGTPVRLDPGLVAMPDLLAAVVLDEQARELVARRRLRIGVAERFERTTLTWSGPDPDRPAILHALVDARSRAALTDFRSGRPAEDPHGVLEALAGDGELELDLPGRRRLEEALDAFRDSGRAVALAATDDELLLRLHQPEPGTTGWLLQSCLREEDGTVHPVDALRAVGDLTPAGAAEAAGAVLRLAPVVREAAVAANGVDWMLTTLQVSRLLAEDAGALERAGVTVMLPREWTTQRTTVRPQAAEGEGEQQKTGGGVGLAAMASFRWRVAVGDVELTEDEIAQIRETQSEIVRLRGQWVRLDPQTLRAAERFLDRFTGVRRPAPPAPGATAVGTAGTDTPQAEAPDADSGAGESGSEDSAIPAEISGRASWAEVFALLLSPEAADLALATETVSRMGGGEGLARLLPGGPGAAPGSSPAGLRATLRPYQQQGLDWMWALAELGLGGILADDMGLGKTMQVLALLCRERERPETTANTGVGPTLLVCPMSVVGAWQREAARFAPHLRVHVHHGAGRRRDAGFADLVAGHDLVITTYALLARDLPLLTRVPWHRLVADEAQYLKTPDTQVTKAARSLRATHRLALTGTPVENRLGDLHSLMEIANPGLLGTAAEFRSRIAEPVEQEGDTGALSRLKYVTSPFVLRRVKTDRSIVADLPEKTELTRVVNLTPEQAGLYEALVDELMASVDGAEENQRRSLVVSTITRLKQVCNHPAHYLGDGSALLRDGAHRSGKLELVDDLLETAFAEGGKVLLFTQFTTFGHLLVPHWAERFGLPVPFLHGGVAKPERDAMVADFQARPEEPGLMLLSLRAGGTGLTLTAANHVVHLDRWWNPAVENQATDRAFRIGQRRDVMVHKLVSAGTVEERIDTVLQEKQELADLTIAPGEDWLADLDDSSLRSLLALDRTAIGDQA